MNRIYGFEGEYSWLSNFWPYERGYLMGPPTPIVIQGIMYPTNEHAFVAAKTTDRILRTAIAAMFPKDPGAIKRYGRRIELRPDWEIVNTPAMLYLVRAKANQHPWIAEALLASGDAELIEANSWGDRKWGVDAKTGIGENRLGKAWMTVRSELAAAAGFISAAT